MIFFIMKNDNAAGYIHKLHRSLLQLIVDRRADSHGCYAGLAEYVGFPEVAFFHRQSRSLLLTDSVIYVPADPPEVIRLQNLLDAATDNLIVQLSMTLVSDVDISGYDLQKTVDDTPASRRKGAPPSPLCKSSSAPLFYPFYTALFSITGRGIRFVFVFNFQLVYMDLFFILHGGLSKPKRSYISSALSSVSASNWAVTCHGI